MTKTMTMTTLGSRKMVVVVVVVDYTITTLHVLSLR